MKRGGAGNTAPLRGKEIMIELVRPSHEDFSKLSRILMWVDDMADVEDHVPRELARGIDSYSVTYVAIQRAMRALGIETNTQLENHQAEVALIAGVWLDGFLVGRHYEEGERSENTLHSPE